ncbi:hypothetical protein B0H10DRAFT_2084231 [Mycena sp. CBHHK59/15]|nr:hypothetical protein B0H10DRAFT_2084231 [Mycena sp. CBHHK59/15]
MHVVHARKRVRRAPLSSIILLSLIVVSALPLPSHVSFCAKSSQSLARSTPSPRAALARASPATTPLAERRRPCLAGLRLDVYVVPPLPCISYISPSRTQRGRLVPNLANQLRDASLHSDAQFTLRGIYRRDAWPHRPGTESPRMHVCSSSLIHVQVRAAFPLPFRRARVDDLVLQR